MNLWRLMKVFHNPLQLSQCFRHQNYQNLFQLLLIRNPRQLNHFQPQMIRLSKCEESNVFLTCFHLWLLKYTFHSNRQKKRLPNLFYNPGIWTVSYSQLTILQFVHKTGVEVQVLLVNHLKIVGHILGFDRVSVPIEGSILKGIIFTMNLNWLPSLSMELFHIFVIFLWINWQNSSNFVIFVSHIYCLPKHKLFMASV